MCSYRERIRRGDYASGAGFCATRTGNYINKSLDSRGARRGTGHGGKTMRKTQCSRRCCSFSTGVCVYVLRMATENVVDV